MGKGMKAGKKPKSRQGGMAGGKDMQKQLKQLQAMQAEMEKKQAELGIEYSPTTEAGRHAAKVEKHSAACYIDERKWSTWINNSGKAMDWMIDKMASKGLIPGVKKASW